MVAAYVDEFSPLLSGFCAAYARVSPVSPVDWGPLVWRVNRWVSSEQLHEAAPGWVWWFDAAISRYKEKTCLFVRFSRAAKISMAPFSLISKVCGHI